MSRLSDAMWPASMIACLLAVSVLAHCGCQRRTSVETQELRTTSQEDPEAAAETSISEPPANVGEQPEVADGEASPADSGEEPTALAAADTDDDSATEPAQDQQPADAQSSGSPSTADQEEVEVAASDEGSASPELARERFLLLATSGPLVIDVRLQINGESYEVIMQRLVDQALATADEDQDGTPTWAEIANSERFQYGQFGNLEVDSDEDRAQLVRMYDTNRDGVVDRGELPRFLTRNVGRARAFSLRSSNEFRSDNRIKSPIRRLLDVDRDGAITKAERAEAPARLLKYDANDDQLLLPSEIQIDQTQQMPRRMSNRRRKNEPDTAVQVSASTNWQSVEYVLSELYAYGDVVGPDDWPAVPELFQRLDADRDESLSVAEVRRLQDVPFHLLLDVSFGTSASDESSETGESNGLAIELTEVSPEIESKVQSTHSYPQRVSIEFQDVEVEFFCERRPSFE